MDTIRDVVEFKSEQFSPVLPEDCQVNPGVYGAELAFWLSQELAKRGVPTSYPNFEDWGWFIEYSPDTGSEFAVHCCNVDGSKDRWLLSLRRFPRKMFGRDKPPYMEAASLVQGIRAVVESIVAPGDVTWHWTNGDAA
ncbi:hypothetical protein [Pseudoxanthomonas wuyuanensis]|uniref:Uncharacterized protein n=1 Tax=Pseudoxanthomonas wuyuanensis TaxID=1073196 RepID=A0A286D1X0_9GAMM|nr:hypothetical protein [Pseudoxanthomonas wuyuanensis]KAF1723193.1 hypothetical protein CSC75_01630 [Pseudoxanthomonas wuyuanensis]SOD52655.1 hypothetical protein SAMN06296416_10216 [Pseudoxanthomonas wuyuanensis]